jgi:hypothetical protein
MALLATVKWQRKLGRNPSDAIMAPSSNEVTEETQQ